MLDFHLDSGGSEMNWTESCIVRKKSKAEIEESFTIALLLIIVRVGARMGNSYLCESAYIL